MTLRLRILKIMGVVSVTALVVLGLTLQKFTRSYLTHVELKEHNERLAIIDRMVEATQQNFEAWASDIAHWDDAYEFMSQGSDEFLDSNLPLSLFLSVNEWNASQTVRPYLVAFVDAQGVPVHFRRFDESSKNLISIPDQDFLQQAKLIFYKMKTDDSVSGMAPELMGYTKYKGGTYQFMAQQVTSSDESKTLPYYLLAFRKWSHKEIESIHKVSGLGVKYSSAAEEFQAHRRVWTDADTIYGDLIYSNPFGEELFKITVHSDRSTYQLGEVASQVFTGLILFFTMIVLIAFAIALDRVVVSRVYKLNKTVQVSKQDSSAIGRLIQKGDDEITQLSRDLHTLFSHLKDISEKDPLTGLENRRAFYANVAKLRESPPEIGVYGTIMFDIDKFKSINDTYGHPQGDEVIKSLAQLVGAHRDEITKAARFGGEEFAIFCWRKDPQEIINLAENIRMSLEKMEIPLINQDQKIKVTASAGVAIESINGGSSLDHLLEESDQALYLSKKNGRNRVTLQPLKAVA